MMKLLHRIIVLSALVLATVAAEAQTTLYVASDADVATSKAVAGYDEADYGTSWSTPMTLVDALDKATSGTVIRVKGYSTLGDGKFYKVPTTAGFTLKAGVELYGGYVGEGDNADDRPLYDNLYNRMKYRSILVGDINVDDNIDDTYLIYPSTGDVNKRTDNATHVITLSLKSTVTTRTVIDGFAIGGGHAKDDKGGGIYIISDATGTAGSGPYTIDRCFILNNYAAEGGGIYVDSNVRNTNNNESYINHSIVFNNVAGTRSEDVNAGGGIYLAGAGTIVNTAIYNNEKGGAYLVTSDSKMLNCTVTRNTNGGVDAGDPDKTTEAESGAASVTVANTVLWGNTRLNADSVAHRPTLTNCAFYWPNSVDEGKGCVRIHSENRGAKSSDDAPYFTSPSTMNGFDRSFKWNSDDTPYPLWTWDLEPSSVLIDGGDTDAYNTGKAGYGMVDIMGDNRLSGNYMDIGAYEYQNIDASSRRLYVKPSTEGGSDTNDGKSWDKALANPQTAIDRLAESGTGKGEVWIAAGTYQPKSLWTSGQNVTNFFRMYDGISVYGGFAGTETSISDRPQPTGDNDMPWQFTKETILQAANYSGCSWSENAWRASSESKHVVWFGPKPASDGSTASDFNFLTYLDGVIIEGGNANSTGDDVYYSDRGGGLYISTSKARVQNCTVRNNTAASYGGGVYCSAGRIERTLIYNNSALNEGEGGGVYVSGEGLVLRSMVTNNSAADGGGIFLGSGDGSKSAYRRIVATTVVSNNTNRSNAAVYADGGGVIEQTTIVNNNTVRATDVIDTDATRTGGLYISTPKGEPTLVINTVIADNGLQGTVSSTAQVYTRQAGLTTTDGTSNVQFLNCGVTAINSTVWNGVSLSSTVSLSELLDSYFETGFPTDDEGVISGVQSTLSSVSYFWQPQKGSALTRQGLNLSLYPDEVLLLPELDIQGDVFEQKPTLGAFCAPAVDIVPEYTLNGSSQPVYRIYVSASPSKYDGDGSSWADNYASLNDAIEYVASLKDGSTIPVYDNTSSTPGNTTKTLSASDNIHFELLIREGDLYPRYNYTNKDSHTATLNISKLALTNADLTIKGGYPAEDDDEKTQSGITAKRNPMKYRSELNGQEGGLYHVVTVNNGAKVTLDGFVISEGYAGDNALYPYGAGLLIHTDAVVTVKNSVFENNKADGEGAAIYGYSGAKLTLTNCVINNNTNYGNTNALTNRIIAIDESNLTLNHVTIVNNIGNAPSSLGSTSFAAGNDGDNNTFTLSTLGKDGAVNFSNPTIKQGAVYNGNVYYGGSAEFRPLTSSSNTSDIINQGGSLNSDIPQDIAFNARDLGGATDLGAYEADLPESGRIIYVRVGGTGKGLTWDDAMGSINDAVDKAVIYNDKLSSTDKADANKRAQVWVAAGTYSGSVVSSNTCFIIKDGVDVFGSFPPTGNPNLDDRNPLLSSKIYNKGKNAAEVATYETILTTSASDARILSQTDSYNPVGGTLTFSYPTCWDGFTITGANLQLASSQRDGGGGARIFENVTLKNCVVSDNSLKTSGTGQRDQIAGGGVYCDEGTIVNCYLINNKMDVGGVCSSWRNTDYAYGAYYGGGAYIYHGTMYNCVVANNYIRSLYADGAALFLENATFFNNTVVNNKAESSDPNGYFSSSEHRSSGGITVWKDDNNEDGGVLYLYNCILAGNDGYKPNSSNYVYGSNQNIGAQYGKIKLTNCLLDSSTDYFYNKNSSRPVTINYENSSNYTTFTTSTGSTLAWKDIFDFDDNSNVANFETCNYRLKGTAGTINMGQNSPNGIDLSTYTDMDYTTRIKNCVIDAGAFERDNEDKITPEVTTASGTTTAVYYVTYNGKNTSNASSPTNPACWTMLQDVLTKAGEYKKTNTAATVIVKVAGYEEGASGEDAGGTYYANTLADANDVQSYTFVVPDGVQLKGGYYQGKYGDDGKYISGSGWDEAGNTASANYDSDYDDYKRDVTKYRTVLSAYSSNLTESVVGYHVITFGSWPENSVMCNYDNETVAESGIVVDGVYLYQGNASEKEGWKAVGGGAVVPKGAHVRNCVIYGNTAQQGGGLYLLPGASVSGTVIVNNTATDGGGVYAANTYYASGAEKTVDSSTRAHIVSCTVAGNTATTGGGMYHEENGPLMVVNSVVWGNNASSDKNISGVLSNAYPDVALSDILSARTPSGTANFYPYNDCFIEHYDVPANTRNTSMESEYDMYFSPKSDNDELSNYIPRSFSPLLNNGVDAVYQDKLTSDYGVAAADMRGEAWPSKTSTTRPSSTYLRLTPGAFSVNVASISTDELVTRLFVSNSGSHVVTAINGSTSFDASKYVGRSFYTPFNSLQAAIQYIEDMQGLTVSTVDGVAETRTVTVDNTHFDIFMAEGTYKPTKKRNTNVAENDERSNSFVIPPNVSIFGGFDNEDPWTSYPSKDAIPAITLSGNKELTKKECSETFDSYVLMPRSSDNTTELNSRISTGRLDDTNSNGLLEPWGFVNQTILSGDIQQSEAAAHVRHVVFSDKDYKESDGTTPVYSFSSDSDKGKGIKAGVVLDGLVIMDGETANSLSNTEATSRDDTEKGHGGGVYSRGVSYTMVRCRFVSNKALYGGAVFLDGGGSDIKAKLNIIGSVFGANEAVQNVDSSIPEDTEDTSLYPYLSHGGAVYVTNGAMLNAVNTLWTNNEAHTYGGAFYADNGSGVNIMNCIFARNKAKKAPVGFVADNPSSDNTTPDSYVTNTVIWGNGDVVATVSAFTEKSINYSHCATDNKGLQQTIDTDKDGNILISEDNMATNGPRFTDPSTAPGVDGNRTSAKWNPRGVTLLTDSGDGEVKYNNASDVKESGAYMEWWDEDHTDLLKYKEDLYRSSDGERKYSKGNYVDNSDRTYARYCGPYVPDMVQTRTIDIGLYEYQYKFTFNQMCAVYVDTVECGTGAGDCWDNATSDLRSAMLAVSNPTGVVKGNNEDWFEEEPYRRTVYVRDGNYFSPLISSHSAAYSIDVPSDANQVSSITIKGACTGVGLGQDAVQDFSKRTTLIPNPVKSDAKTLLDISLKFPSTTTKKEGSESTALTSFPVTMEGFTFKSNTSESNPAVLVTGIDDKCSLTLKNCEVSGNKGDGITVSNGVNSGSVLIYNTLFADNSGTALTPDGTTTVVNATFANNVTDVSAAPDYGDTGFSVYNTVSWNKPANSSNTQNIADSETTHNVVNENVNDDIETGPNFVDPDKGDYSIRPSVKLLNKGSNDLYVNKVVNAVSDADATEIPDTEKELGNNKRLTGTAVDIGAYEYSAELQPIIYVKDGLTTTGDGKSWDTALGDLQSAVDLAGIYATDENGLQCGYVFADRYVNVSGLKVSLPGVKVYGGMNGEWEAEYTAADESTGTEDNAGTIVTSLLDQRKGTIERVSSSNTGNTMSTICGLTLSGAAAAATDDERPASVVDGFSVTGAVTVNGGALSTSVVTPTSTDAEGNAAVTGSTSGLLYNSLVYGGVSGVKTVNVTATGTVTPADGSTNNRASVTDKNTHVAYSHWEYQLEETSADIDVADGDGARGKETAACEAIVGHERDLAGNSRIRNTVDNGCFETWNITADYEMTSSDYPRGLSVVYVRKEAELSMADEMAEDFYPSTSPFCPGYLLLEHHAGLRGNGNCISLDGNFAVERNLTNGTPDFVVLPFDVSSTEYRNGLSETDVTTSYYDGAERMASEYAFSSTDGAWKSSATSGADAITPEGCLLETAADGTIRFNGKTYSEGNGMIKSVTLKQYNDREAASPATFTHKENMGWNLFGSPYLCAMNYSDMEYGRVLYGWQSSQYKVVNTVDKTSTVDNAQITGYVPAFDAVFTQTATLKETETFRVNASSAKSGTAYAGAAEISVWLTRSGTRVAGQEGDVLQLTAVPAAEAHAGFDIASDGVKWMTSDRPQLYAEQGGGRYSLLSAVSIDGEVPVGVTLPEGGIYTFSLPVEEDTEDGADDNGALSELYETVVLKDAQAGRTVDLLQTDYTFSTAEGGDISGRFSISFNSKVSDAAQNIRAWSIGNGRIRVSGVSTGDRITVYSAEGMQMAAATARLSTTDITANVSAVAIVEVTRAGKTVKTVKLKIKH